MTVNKIDGTLFSALSALSGRTLSTLTAVNGQTIDAGGCGLLPGVPTTNLQFDYVGECLVGVDGATVTSWDDSSAAANDLSQVSGGPLTKETNVINGLSVLRAAAATDWTFATSITVTDFTYIAVVNLQDLIGQRTLIAGNAGSPQVRFNAGKINLLKQATADLGSSTTALTPGTFYTIGLTYSSPNVAFYLNGAADGTASNAATFTANLIRCFIANGVENWAGDIAEQLFWTSVLSGANLTTVFSALQTKYAHY